MRVLFLDQFSEMGGAQRCLADLTPFLLNAGWDVQAALPRPGSLAEFLTNSCVPVHYLRCGPYTQGRKTLSDVLRFTADYRAASAAISRLTDGADLVYVNGPRLMPAAAHACRGVPVLFHSHSRVAGRFALALARRALKRSNASVIASSRFVAQPWQSYAGGGRINVIYNGTPEIPFRLRSAPIRRPWTIGVIGRISPEKGQLEFIRAAQLIAARTKHVRFVVHGAPLWSPPAYVASVRAAGSGLDIRYIGWEEPVANTLHELDLLVVPSPSDESSTRVIPEAFSAGTPVVAFPSGGIPEIIRHRQTGFLADSVSADALAAAILDAMEDAADLPRIVAAARAKWESAFTVRYYCESVMKEMLAATRRFRGETSTVLTAK